MPTVAGLRIPQTTEIESNATPVKRQLRSDSNSSTPSPMRKSSRSGTQGSPNTPLKVNVISKSLNSSLNLCGSPQEKQSSETFAEKTSWDARDNTQLRVVKEVLHVSTAPATVMCREDEQNRILDFCKECVEQEKSASLYVCGCPGTGKSLSIEKVREILVNWTKEGGKSPPDVLSVNCTSLTNTSEIFSKILGQHYPTKGVNHSTSLQLLEKLYSQKQQPPIKMILFIADEMDYLITKDRKVLHDLFMLTTLPFSKCILLGIANAIDLADRFIPKLQSLNCKPMVITFRAYSKDQIITILQERLRALPYTVFQRQALELCARKVAAASGDMRKALSICRSAIELLEAEVRNSTSDSNSSMLERIEDQQKPAIVSSNQLNNAVRVDHVATVLSKTYKSPIVDMIQSLPQHQQIILCSAAKLFRGGKKDRTLGELNKCYTDICKLTSIPAVGFLELSSMCRVLADQGIFKLGQSRENKLRRMSLKVDEADIMFALQGIRYFRNCLQ